MQQMIFLQKMRGILEILLFGKITMILKMTSMKQLSILNCFLEIYS